MAAAAAMVAAQVGIPMLMQLFNKKKGGGESGGGESPASTAQPASAGGGGAPNIMPPGASPGMATGLGIGQLVQGHMQRKKADRAEPTLEDPQQVLAMQEYQRRANNAMTGAGVSSAQRDLQQSRAGAYRALAQSGNVGQYGALSRNLAQEQNQLLAQGQQTEMGYRGMFDKMLNTVADRRLRLQSKKADMLRQRSEANIAGGTQNALAGIASMGKLGGGGMPGTTGGDTGAGGGMPKMHGAVSGGMIDSPTQTMPGGEIMGFGGMPIPGMG
jgi:hypothetical protein